MPMSKNIFILSYALFNLCFAFNCNAASTIWDSTPYVGANLQMRHMDFKKPYNTGVNKNYYPQGNIYLGLRCHKFFGFEFGFDKSVRNSNNPNLPFASLYMNGDVTGPEGVKIRTKTISQGYHGSMVGFIPLNTAFDLKLITLLGVARLQTNIALQDCRLDGRERWSRVFNFKKKAWAPRLGFGAQSMINHHIGIRALLIFEQTSRFGRILESQNQKWILKPSNSLISSLGLFYQF